MRLFGYGMVVGLVFGLAFSASAAYIGTERWQNVSAGSDFHLGYVAGIIDTVQALKAASFLTRQTISEALDAADSCTATVTLGAATARAENIVNGGQVDANAADEILVGFMKCQ